MISDESLNEGITIVASNSIGMFGIFEAPTVPVVDCQSLWLLQRQRLDRKNSTSTDLWGCSSKSLIQVVGDGLVGETIQWITDVLIFERDG